MKRSILILAVLLPVFAHAEEPMQLARMNPYVLGAGVPVVAGEDCTPTADVISESFGDGATACYSGAEGDDATCDNTWSVSGDSHTFHHALQSGAPTGSCTYGLLHDTSNENGEYVIKQINGAYTTTHDIEFTLYINSFTIDANGNQTFFVVGQAASDANYAVILQFLDVSGTAKYLRTHPYSSSTIPISTETWYTVTLHLDATAANSYIKVVGGGNTTCDTDSECKFTRYDKNYTYVTFGAAAGQAATEAMSYEIGYIKVNTP